MDRLSTALRQTLDTIRTFIQEHGIPPTYQEIGDIRGIKAPSVFEQVQQLLELGILRQAPRRSRNLEVVEPPPPFQEDSEWISVPIVGEVPAGHPVLCEENIVGEVQVEKSVIRNSLCFALKVVGESMIGANIFPGDFVVIRQQPIAENGEIVVALVNGEQTLKRLKIYPSRWELQPENTLFDPINLKPDDELRIVGKVIGITRKEPTRQ